MNKPLVTIVIPAYNCERTISLCLQACSAQTYNGPLEIIVVDDGSTDQTAQKIQSFSNVKYLRQNNAGPATARNQGAAAASGEFICFTDSDCVPHQDWVEQLLEPFTDAGVGVVAGSYGIKNTNSLLARCIYAEIIWRHAHLMPKFPKSFGSYNFCSRKEVFKKIGSFNTSYRFASGEDNDLSYKMLQSGFKILFEPKALVDHFHTEDLGKYLREQCRHGYWRAKLYFEHPAMSRGDDYTFWKDMIEVPLTTLIIGILPLCWGHPDWINIWIWGCCALVFIEFFFANLMIKNLFFSVDFFYWAGVMTARAFTRTLGFWAGFFRFFPALFSSK